MKSGENFTQALLVMLVTNIMSDVDALPPLPMFLLFRCNVYADSPVANVFPVAMLM